MRARTYVAENAINPVVDKNIQKAHPLVVMAKPKPKAKKLTKVAFVPSDAENATIQAGLQKYGLRKATDIIRMALHRFAEAEGLQLKAS